jgi:hypothetical protein
VGLVTVSPDESIEFEANAAPILVPNGSDLCSSFRISTS